MGFEGKWPPVKQITGPGREGESSGMADRFDEPPPGPAREDWASGSHVRTVVVLAATGLGGPFGENSRAGMLPAVQSLRQSRGAPAPFAEGSGLCRASPLSGQCPNSTAGTTTPTPAPASGCAPHKGPAWGPPPQAPPELPVGLRGQELPQLRAQHGIPEKLLQREGIRQRVGRQGTGGSSWNGRENGPIAHFVPRGWTPPWICKPVSVSRLEWRVGKSVLPDYPGRLKMPQISCKSGLD